ncbi:histidine phosphatase superfamily protein [Emydomyces testavorans]|uniref:Histidine phosphatase superfamily protein n=1 Tax=Emydomyces testavorans TaxID=2070801 RepID=A0AAF0DF06_9EURO|nr:histidine phosphatase superfamily protein [Emydomyces testavorans]
MVASVSLFTTETSAETVLGAYIFSRHGDRTPKSIPPTVLTDLGYRQMFMSGQYYRERYLSSSSNSRIQGINADIVTPGQLSASAPADEVLQKSATAFFQGLYPPTGKAAKSTLRNGTEIEAPMNGYQLVAIEQVDAGGNSENVAWLQSASNCHDAKVSSNNYYTSEPYKKLLDSTADFYKSLTPMVKNTFSSDQINYKNAYTIFDLINVASIHNSSDNFPSSDLLTPSTYSHLLELANEHEFNLSYNESEPIRAVSGSVLAGEILAAFQELISSKGAATKLNVQFGAYASFLAFFGLTQLPKVYNDFNGVPDYASTMAFELVTNASSSSFPDPSDISVRFLFHNGTIPSGAQPSEFALFKQPKTVLPWSEFSSSMKKISIASQEEWCKACGNKNGECAASNSSPKPTTTAQTEGLSKAQAGAIGAMVTLGVILAAQTLFMLIGGFRFVRKSSVIRIDDMAQKTVA